MDRAKEAIASSFNGNEARYRDVFGIIDKRWEIQLRRPLHAAGHFLNPEFFYSNPMIEEDQEVSKGFNDYMQRLVPDIGLHDKINQKLSFYKNASGTFGMPIAIRN